MMEEDCKMAGVVPLPRACALIQQACEWTVFYGRSKYLSAVGLHLRNQANFLTRKCNPVASQTPRPLYVLQASGRGKSGVVHGTSVMVSNR